MLLKLWQNGTSHWEEGALAGNLKTTFGRAEDVRGMFRLVLFWGAFPQQLGRVAFLDCADDGIDFVPYAPDDEYRIVDDLPPQEALEQAGDFVSVHPDFQHISLAKVLDADGTILGFEVCPHYSPTAFGTSDVLDVSYRRKDERVVIFVHLQSGVERQLSGN